MHDLTKYFDESAINYINSVSELYAKTQFDFELSLIESLGFADEDESFHGKCLMMGGYKRGDNPPESFVMISNNYISLSEKIINDISLGIVKCVSAGRQKILIIEIDQ